MSRQNLPPVYSFPPLYTIQPNPASKQKQIRAWVELVRLFCTHNKVYVLDLHQEVDLFTNLNIRRSVSQELKTLIFKECVETGLAEWTNLQKSCSSIYILWKSIAEWSALVYDFIESKGFLNTVMTGFELRQGDYVLDTEFYKMHPVLFRRAIQHLIHQKKCILINESDIVDELGLKFISA